jgi:hypothetical protein
MMYIFIWNTFGIVDIDNFLYKQYQILHHPAFKKSYMHKCKTPVTSLHVNGPSPMWHLCIFSDLEAPTQVKGKVILSQTNVGIRKIPTL